MYVFLLQFSTSCPCHTKPVVPAQCSHPNVSGRIKPHSVHIAWSPPDYDGGSRILQYAVKQITDLSKPSDGFEISRDARRDLIVFQLSPGTVYGFSVCAINSVGVSRPPSFQLLNVLYLFQFSHLLDANYLLPFEADSNTY